MMIMMNNLIPTNFEDFVDSLNPDAYILDGLNDCILGVVDGVLCYSYTRLVEHFVHDGMSHDEAVDWVSFNIIGLNPTINTFLICDDHLLVT